MIDRNMAEILATGAGRTVALLTVVGNPLDLDGVKGDHIDITYVTAVLAGITRAK